MIEPVDIPSVTQLNGIFAPTAREVDGPMEVVAGAVPADLAGAYLRNGPNPRFPPIGSYSYPLDGDDSPLVTLYAAPAPIASSLCQARDRPPCERLAALRAGVE